ncbi:hypothetical protein BSG1_19869 [Bacillus sp. SG-1]|nr:hypothetical protein BSG1_19869 [Bacillus sp. SG-1]
MLSNPILIFFKLITENFSPIWPIFLDISSIREIYSFIIEAHGLVLFLALASMLDVTRNKKIRACFEERIIVNLFL